MINKKDIKIGLQFKRNRGKKTPKIETIVDILKTYNSKNELVKTRYVTEYDFISQKIKDYDTCIVGIQMGEKIN